MLQRKISVLVTGANGFIGKNLIIRLGELSVYKILPFVRGDNLEVLADLVAKADVVIHLAGENRPEDEASFHEVNAGLTFTLCDEIRKRIFNTGCKLPLVLASSTQVRYNNKYGNSKLEAEKAVSNLALSTANPSVIFRLPGVFGKWCRPNYNSVVATFCHNITRGLPIKINDSSTSLSLVYVDDVVSALISAIISPADGLVQGIISPEYSITLGELAAQLESFHSSRNSLLVDPVGIGLPRALYATYVSYLPPKEFLYSIPQYKDARGVFVEMLKTSECGQFSFFTAHPGITRGGHYHHTKTEKFLVIKGRALFRFRHITTGEFFEVLTSGDFPQIVDTIPGWAHDITNMGDDELLVMLWANEIFDRDNPDTFNAKV